MKGLVVMAAVAWAYFLGSVAFAVAKAIETQKHHSPATLKVIKADWIEFPTGSACEKACGKGAVSCYHILDGGWGACIIATDVGFAP